MVIPNVSAITSECDCDIEIIPSDEDRVVYYYDKKQYQNRSEFANGELHLDFSSEKSNFLFLGSSSGINVKVYCNKLNSITQSGVGDVKTMGQLSSDTLRISNEGVGDMNLEIKTTFLSLNNTGVGDIKLKGEAINTSISNEGTGDVEAKKLSNKTAVVNNSGVGDVNVYATDTLNLNNSGVGDINYYGAAVVSSVISEGVGKVDKK